MWAKTKASNIMDGRSSFPSRVDMKQQDKHVQNRQVKKTLTAQLYVRAEVKEHVGTNMPAASPSGLVPELLNAHNTHSRAVRAFLRAHDGQPGTTGCD